MTGSVMALMGSAASGGGGGSDLTVVVSPDPLEYYYNGATYTATAFATITGGLEPYSTEWFLSGGDASAIYAATDAVTVESFTGATCSVYAVVTDDAGNDATSNTITVQLPA